MHIGIAADHGGFELKVQLTAALKTAGYEVTDFGAHDLVTEHHRGNVENDTATSANLLVGQILGWQ